MPRVVFNLNRELYRELEAAAAESREMTYHAEQWAADCVASALASRRLSKVRIPVTPLDALERKPVLHEE